jgi:hypothetical protein
MRVRKPSNRGGVKKIISKFPSYRMNRTVYAEGTIELDYLYLLEYDHPNVIYFAEQPGRINYELDGRWRYYTPDFHVQTNDEHLIVEVKRKDDALEEENQRLFRIAADACAKEGYRFVVMTDEVIREQPRLDNIKLLSRYERIDIDNPLYQIACHEFFTGRGEANLDEIMRFFESRKVGKQAVYALLFWRVLVTDLTSAIGPESIVRLPGREVISERRAS